MSSSTDLTKLNEVRQLVKVGLFTIIMPVHAKKNVLFPAQDRISKFLVMNYQGMYIDKKTQS